jgi:TolB protein
VFEVQSRNGRLALTTAGLDGRSRRVLVSERNCDVEAPAWSRTGTIAFFADCDGGGRIEAVDVAGRNRRTLVHSASPFTTTAISWSPDGKHFAFAANGTLRIGALRGGSRPGFALPAGQDGAPAWSADGTRLAATVYPEATGPAADFVSSPLASPAWSPDGRRLVGTEGDGGQTVAILDLRTNEKSVIYQDEGLGYASLGDPAWAPDGRLLAFSVLDTDSLAFYDVARGDFVELGKRIAGQHPAWSPDGSRIAYDTTSTDGSTRVPSVLTARPDGTAVERIARNASDPAWSPDGKEIVFVRSLGGNRELYLMHADGTGQRRLTVNPGLDAAPDWQPLPVTSRSR